MANRNSGSDIRELSDLIGQAHVRLKAGDSEMSEEYLQSLFRVDLYYQLREEYRFLLITILELEDSDPVKQKGYAFISDVIRNTGSFDMSVILAMLYLRINSLTADLFCDFADEIGEGPFGNIIYNAISAQLVAGIHHDVIKRTKTELTDEEKALLSRIVDAYRKYA